MFKDLPDNLAEVQARLRRGLEWKSRFEINYVESATGLVACFDRETFYITDGDLRPILAYEATAFGNAVAISDSGRYAIFQTAHNQQHDEDSGAFALIDVEKREIIGKRRIETGWKAMTHLFLDEQDRCFWVYYGDNNARYDFDFKADPETLKWYAPKKR